MSEAEEKPRDPNDVLGTKPMSLHDRLSAELDKWVELGGRLSQQLNQQSDLVETHEKLQEAYKSYVTTLTDEISRLREVLAFKHDDAITSEARNWLANAGYLENICQLTCALDESVKLQSHYAKLLNVYDGGERMLFEHGQSWLDRLRAMGRFDKVVKPTIVEEQPDD